MAITLSCPGCDRTLRLPDEKAGGRTRCPDCGAVVSVPAASAEEEIETAVAAEDEAVLAEEAVEEDEAKPQAARGRSRAAEEELAAPPRKRKRGSIGVAIFLVLLGVMLF